MTAKRMPKQGAEAHAFAGSGIGWVLVDGSSGAELRRWPLDEGIGRSPTWAKSPLHTQPGCSE